MVLLFLVPGCALADLRRGDSGEDVTALQQMLFETGFLFALPDGRFGKASEAAVKWFQEYALLEPSGVVDDRTLDSLYACWLQITEENGMAEPVPDDNMEPQTAGFIPGYSVEGDYPAYCHRYTTDEGNEHVEMCGRHAEVAMDNTLPGVEKWTKALNELYDEWLETSLEEDRAAVASSQAFFKLWLEQQATAFKQQSVADVDDRIEALLRNQCVELCERVYEARTE